MSSYFSTLLWGTSQLDDAVDKATSELMPSGSEDIALNLEISDQIRSKSVQPKDAMRALKRRLNHKNPNVQLLALGLTDTCIKNGGDPFLVEIASREFMDNLVSILKIPALNHDVKKKTLRLIQNWAIAFEGKPTLGYMGQVFKTLQNEGFNFPPRDLTAASSAMVDTQTAPEWIDSDVCLRCRTAFTFTNRKHHCRNCGQVFDQQCSSKNMTLPHFGITQEVRVCDGCYTKLIKKNVKAHKPSQSVSNHRHHAAREYADADLQRAIQLSLEEVGAVGGHRPGYVPSSSPWQSSEPPLVDRKTYPATPLKTQANEEEDDPELRAAIEASLREASAPKPSAPLSFETPRSEYPPAIQHTGYPSSYPPSSTTPKPTALPNYDLEPLETDAILTFSQTVEQLQNQGGRDLSRYPAVTELYDKASSLRPKLAMNMSDTGRKEQLLTEMHDKLSQAVKLYDKLLTEQVSHPPWRAASVQPYPAQPQHQSQSPVSAPSQPQWLPASPRLQAQPYFAQAQPVSVPQAPPTGTNVYGPPQGVTSQYAPAPRAYQTGTSPQPDYTHAPYPQQSHQFTATSPAPVSVPQYQPPAVSTHPTISATPASPAQSPQPHAGPQYSTSAPPVQYTAAPPSQPTLARHNTVNSANPTYVPAPPKQQLGRANTVHASSHTTHQLQQLQAAPAPPQIPILPTAPTGLPLQYSAYGAPAQEEQPREALLIDL